MCAANYWILRLLFVAVRSERRPSRSDTPFEMRPGKAGGNYRLDRLFVHECGCMAALAIPAGTANPWHKDACRDGASWWGARQWCVSRTMARRDRRSDQITVIAARHHHRSDRASAWRYRRPRHHRLPLAARAAVAWICLHPSWEVRFSWEVRSSCQFRPCCSPGIDAGPCTGQPPTSISPPLTGTLSTVEQSFLPFSGDPCKGGATRSH